MLESNSPGRGAALFEKSEEFEPLADRIARGDRAAECELIEVYRHRVFALAVARVRDPVVADDLTQETLLAALEALRAGKLSAAEKLPAFLRGIARNLCNNHLRGLSRRTVELPTDLRDRNPDPELSARHTELLAVARKCLAELEPMDQKILLWSLVDRLTSQEIGRRLGIRPETARQHKHRALVRLRERSRDLSQNASPDHKGSGGSQ